MTDDLAAHLAGLQRAMAAPLPSPEELAAWQAEDKAMAGRIHQARPGVPVHHVYAVLETLRVIRRVDAAKEAPEFPLPIRPDGSHAYVSTACACTGDKLMADGRTGHEYCAAMTGWQGAKRGGRAKCCGAPCQCNCHGWLVLPKQAVAALTELAADKAATSDDATDIAGEQP